MNNPLPSIVASFRSGLLRIFAPVIAVVLLLVLLAAMSLDVLSALRAFVSSESLWSKAENSAVAELRRYLTYGNEPNYQRFLTRLEVPLGARTARLAIDRNDPNPQVAVDGFLAGGNHRDDIDSMIRLYRHFKHAPHVGRAVSYWVEGDALIAQVGALGTKIHAARQAGRFEPGQQETFSAELDRLESAFGPIEDGFSAALGNASRLTLQLLSFAIFLVALALLYLLHIFFRRLLRQSEQSRAELALSEERLRLGFKGTKCGLWDWDIATDLVFYSPWIYNLLEYKSSILSPLDDNFIDTVHPDDRAAVLAAGSAHIINRVPYDVEFRVRTASGNYLWLRSRAEALRNADGKAVRMVGSIFDISELKQAGHQAYMERELAQITLAAIADAVIRTDPEGCIDYCNAIAEALLGRSFESIRGQPLWAACPIFDDVTLSSAVDVVTPMLSGQAPAYNNANLYLARHTGGVSAMDVSVASVRDQAGYFFGAVVVLHDVSAEREHAAQLSHQARHDELTGLVNRREFERQLAALLVLPASERVNHAIMYLDLDQLKIVNDSGGHAAGDQLIRQLSALLKQRLRERDLLARLGGDEFGIILKHCQPEDAVEVAESLRKIIFDTRFIWEGKSYPTGLSIGLITEIDQFASLGELMKVADAACFMAKEKGRNRVQCYHADNHELSLRHREIEWVARIGEALDQDRFRLYSQRIVPAAIADQGDQHLELLLRMVDADGRLIPPMSFIPAAERYNLMPKIDRWVIAAAFRKLAEARAGGVALEMVTCAINLSGTSIGDEAFLAHIMEQQRLYAIPFSSICFEITETAAIANLPKAVAFIAELRAVGCLFSLDDFGAGMASFGYLKHLPVDFLKIDGSFVKDMLTDPIDFAMVEAINQIGHVMGKKTIAEFVENDAVFQALKRIGVDYAQGYGIGVPRPFTPASLQIPHDPVLRHQRPLTDRQTDLSLS